MRRVVPFRGGDGDGKPPFRRRVVRWWTKRRVKIVLHGWDVALKAATTVHLINVFTHH